MNEPRCEDSEDSEIASQKGVRKSARERREKETAYARGRKGESKRTTERERASERERESEGERAKEIFKER